MSAAAGVPSSAQPVSGVWDLFSNLATMYVQDRQAERASVAAFNQYSYNSLANADPNLISLFPRGNSVGGSEVGGFALTANHLVIGAILAAAVYFAVK